MICEICKISLRSRLIRECPDGQKSHKSYKSFKSFLIVNCELLIVICFYDFLMFLELYCSLRRGCTLPTGTERQGTGCFRSTHQQAEHRTPRRKEPLPLQTQQQRFLLAAFLVQPYSWLWLRFVRENGVVGHNLDVYLLDGFLQSLAGLQQEAAAVDEVGADIFGIAN